MPHLPNPEKVEQFWKAVRVADYIDVVLVAVALAVLLGWLKRRTTRPLLTAAALGMIVYGLALWQQLYLTLWLFRAGLVVLLAAVLVAFQDDLRRGFERLAAGDAFRPSGGPDNVEQAVAVLTEAVFDFAQRQVGALFILPGKELLDRHLQGGWVAEAKLSMPLLLSIFDPSSPGHDGAALIDADGRLARMGSHLPLSGNLDAIAGRGTRHAAALGLAERSDALLVVVSEERGEVSLGRDGRLDLVTTQAELSTAITTQLEMHRPATLRSTLRVRDPEIKLAAIALAALLWFMIAAPSEPVQEMFFARIQTQHLPQGWTIGTFYPDEVRVTVEGPKAVIRGLGKDELRLEFDLSRLSSGNNTLNVESAKLNLPAPLHVARFEPPTVWVTAYPPGTGPPRP